jgi:hypothetical protein
MHLSPYCGHPTHDIDAMTAHQFRYHRRRRRRRHHHHQQQLQQVCPDDNFNLCEYQATAI